MMMFEGRPVAEIVAAQRAAAELVFTGTVVAFDTSASGARYATLRGESYLMFVSRNDARELLAPACAGSLRRDRAAAKLRALEAQPGR